MENPIIPRKIANVMKIVTFLYSDYIIYKDDIGVEMYFIIKGKAAVMSPSEHK